MLATEVEAIDEGMKGNAESLRIQTELCETLQDIDPQPIRDRMSEADTTNEAVLKKQEKNRLQSEADEAESESKRLTAKIEAIDRDKQTAIEEAEWPVDGMSVDEDGVLLDGLPFEQASTAQRVMASVKVGMALNPKLRLLVCQHGNDLDNETLEALGEALRDEDFQMLLETVTRSEQDEARCAVVFKDGQGEVMTSEDVDPS